MKILAILLFLIFLPCASSDEFSYPGQLQSPGPLVLPSDIAVNANASGRAITASIETAAMMMSGAGQGPESIDSNPETGFIELGPLPINAASLFSAEPAAALSICGMVFNDLKGEGPRTKEKTGIAGWTLILKSEGKEDLQTVSDEMGQYSFENLAPGKYALTQVTQEGWNQTSPLEGSYEIELVDINAQGYDFGNHFGPVPIVERTYRGLSFEQMERMSQHEMSLPQAPTGPEAMKEPMSYPSSFSLLSHVPNYSSRDQGDCGNCWVWGCTAVMEIAHHIQDGIFSRLSIQYLNSNHNGGTGSWACCGGSPTDFSSFYNSKEKFIPWSNANANFRDGSQVCSESTTMPAGSISTTPNYPISSLTQYYISTHSGQEAAINSIKYILNQNKGVTFRFGAPNEAAWSSFVNYWNTNSGTFDFAAWQGQTIDSGYCGHEVTCVGYDDSSDSWIMLNSWGTNAAHPDGTFKVKMHTNYDLTFSSGGYQLFFGTFDVAFTQSAPAWTGLGGYTTYKHTAITDNQGRRHVFVVGGDNALWDNVDGSWVYIGGSITSTPYPAKDKFGRIHIVVRGADYALWDFVFDTASWNGGWSGLGGYLSSLATAAMEPTYGNYMKIVARGGDNSLWICDFDVNDLSSYYWTGLGGNLNSWPFIIFDSNSRMHILARGGDNGLWDNRGVLSSESYEHSWHGLGGIITEAPFAILEPSWASFIAAMVRGADNSLWMADINVLSNPETCTWHSLGGAISSEAFSATDSANSIHTFVRGSDGAMWENVFSSSPWNPSGAHWISHGGSITDWSPQALISSQTYAYVLGGDNAIWHKVYATSSALAASSEAEAFGKSDSPVQSEEVVAGGTGASIPMS